MSLTTAETRALKTFLAALEDAFPNQGVELRLFGSKARGDDREDSDVDVLVLVTDEGWEVADQVYRAATEVQLATGVLLSPEGGQSRPLPAGCVGRHSFLSAPAA